MHAYDEAFMNTPLLDAATSHSGDLADLERLDNVLIGSISICGGSILHRWAEQISRDCLPPCRPHVLPCITMQEILALDSSAASTTTWRRTSTCRILLGASQRR